MHPAGISVGTSFHQGERERERKVVGPRDRGVVFVQRHDVSVACGLFGIKSGVPRIPLVIASPGARARNDCIFGPRHGINSKNLCYPPFSTHPSHITISMTGRSPALSAPRARIRCRVTLIFENRSARFHVKASTFPVEALRLPFVRGTLNGIVNFNAPLTLSVLTIINALWSG